MDGKATDNICIERFWRSAKVEKIYLNEYERVSVLKSDVKDYIEFYNYRRFHETLKYKKPMNVYYASLKINDENYTKTSENVAYGNRCLGNQIFKKVVLTYWGSINFNRRHGSLRKELNVRTPFDAVGSWFQTKPEIFKILPDVFQDIACDT